MNEIITEDYYEGQGCTCYATSANECGCEGADWTPTEVYKLREDAKQLALERDEAREHLREIAEYGTEEINAAVDLRQKLARALLERDEAREQNVKLRDIADTAIEYVGHTSVQQKLRIAAKALEGAK